MQVGIGIRRQHFAKLLKLQFQADWFEIISENYINYGGKPQLVLERLREHHYPIVCHGLGLSLGSADPIDQNYLLQLKSLVERLNSPWFSDHLCLSSVQGIQFHDLIPTLRTEETVALVAQKIKQIQLTINKPFAIENISYYVESSHHQMSELEFIQEILNRGNSLMLLDINNVYVNARNFGFDPKEFLRQIPHERVAQIHLAGHEERGHIIIDTHGGPVAHPVWELYEWYLAEAGRPIPTLIEWDNQVPAFEVLEQQVQMAKQSLCRVFATQPLPKEFITMSAMSGVQ